MSGTRSFWPSWPSAGCVRRSPSSKRPSTATSERTTGLICRQIIDHIEFLDHCHSLESPRRSSLRLAPFERAVTLIGDSVPGISRTTAEVIIAETGADMSRFPTAGLVCAWAGLAPRLLWVRRESVGPRSTRQGAPWLRRTLVEAARAAARTKGTYFSAQYVRIAKRRGPNKATVAVAHSMLEVVWHLLTTGALYEDPGADYFNSRHDPAVEAKRLTHRIEQLGFEVNLTPRAA